MLCGKYFRDTLWNGDHAMKIFTFLKRVFKDLKILTRKNILWSDEENYDREVMKYQTNAPKENCLYCSIILSK